MTSLSNPIADTTTISLPNKTKLTYRITGPSHGETLILIHANISDLRSWEPLLESPILTSHFRLIAYSRRYAYPNPPIPDKAPDPWELHAEDLIQLIEALNLGPAHLLGNSTGATVALLVAKDRPDLVKTLTLEEPPLISLFLPSTPPSISDVLALLWNHPLSFFPVMYFGATAMAPTTSAFQRGDDEAALHAFARGIVDTPTYNRLLLDSDRLAQMRANVLPLRALFNFGGLPAFSEDDTRRITTRALVLSAEKTVVSQRHINQRLAALLPNATLVYVEGASHLIHEDCPERVAEAVLEFVRKGE